MIARELIFCTISSVMIKSVFDQFNSRTGPSFPRRYTVRMFQNI